MAARMPAPPQMQELQSADFRPHFTGPLHRDLASNPSTPWSYTKLVPQRLAGLENVLHPLLSFLFSAKTQESFAFEVEHVLF